MAVDSRIKKRVFWLAPLSGPAFFVVMFLLKGPPRPREHFEVALVVVGISILVTAIAAIGIWIAENPTARLHGNEGLSRLARVAILAGPIWLGVWALSDNINSDGELTVSLLMAVAISVLSWFLVNALGWVIEGFARPPGE